MIGEARVENMCGTADYYQSPPVVHRRDPHVNDDPRRARVARACRLRPRCAGRGPGGVAAQRAAEPGAARRPRQRRRLPAQPGAGAGRQRAAPAARRRLPARDLRSARRDRRGSSDRGARSGQHRHLLGVRHCRSTRIGSHAGHAAAGLQRRQHGEPQRLHRERPLPERRRPGDGRGVPGTLGRPGGRRRGPVPQRCEPHRAGDQARAGLRAAGPAAERHGQRGHQGGRVYLRRRGHADVLPRVGRRR